MYTGMSPGNLPNIINYIYMINLFANPFIRKVSFDWIYNPTYLFVSAIVDLIFNYESSLKYRDSGFRKDLARTFSNLEFFTRKDEIVIVPIIFILSSLISGDQALRTQFYHGVSGKVPYILKLMLEHIRIGQFKDGGLLHRIIFSDSYYDFISSNGLKDSILDIDYLRGGGMSSAILFLQSVASYSSPTSVSRQDGYTKTVNSRNHEFYSGNTLGLTGMTCIEGSFIGWHQCCTFVKSIPSQIHLILCNSLFCELRPTSVTPFPVSYGPEYCDISHTNVDLAYAIVQLVLFGDSDDQVSTNDSIVSTETVPVSNKSSSKSKQFKNLNYEFKRTRPSTDRLDLLDEVVSAFNKLLADVVGYQYVKRYVT